MDFLLKFLGNPKTLVVLAACTAFEFFVLGSRVGVGDTITVPERHSISGADGPIFPPPQTPNEAALQLFGVADGIAMYGHLVDGQISSLPRLNEAGLVPPRSEIKASVDGSLVNLDAAMRQTPRAILALAMSLREHGLAALAYTDPAVKEETDKLGILLGRGLRQMADAVAADMVLTAQDVQTNGVKK